MKSRRMKVHGEEVFMGRQKIHILQNFSPKSEEKRSFGISK
jgi:hypothetical protein